MAPIRMQINAKKKLSLKIVFDIALFIIWVVLMAYSLTGAFLHELIGLISVGLILLHIVFNYKWVLSVSKKVFSSRFSMNSFKYLLDFVLLFMLLFVGISGILISKKILFMIYASDLSLWIYLHHVSAYITMIAISVHIGIHGKMILSVFRSCFSIERKNKVRSIVLEIFAMAIIIWGIAESFDYSLPQPNISETHETTMGQGRGQGNGTKAGKDKASVFQIAPIMGLWVLGAHYTVRLISERKRRPPKKDSDPDI